MKLINSIIKASLLGLFLFFISSCMLSIPKEKRACYKKLKSFANKNWEFSNNDSVLIDKQELYKPVLHNKELVNCAKEMTTKEIMLIFGKPHEIHTNEKIIQYYYFTHTGCYPLDKTRFCNFYAFDFNSSEQCVSFLTGGVERSH